METMPNPADVADRMGGSPFFLLGTRRSMLRLEVVVKRALRYEDGYDLRVWIVGKVDHCFVDA